MQLLYPPQVSLLTPAKKKLQNDLGHHITKQKVLEQLHAWKQKCLIPQHQEQQIEAMFPPQLFFLKGIPTSCTLSFFQ